ncbi:hypothetical protein PV05_04977 [Exophiala xenobiotica]|uniref:Uncharacterized protein n=1 Tax=Exophiala xenobiotica TaxID=348802 RepID=A0A0D2F8D9_9EURO|nr:uncharacterized protein PV05_04977 [Exophiala xenobiotica]KIW56309.1 hypothetical protein PV05_04977 [Exophiala xenobiotica]
MALVTLGYEQFTRVQPPKVNIAQECVLDLCLLDCNVSVNGGIPETKVLHAQHGVQFQRNFTVGSVSNTLWCWRQPGVGEADLYWASSGPDAINLFDDYNMAFCLELGVNMYDPFDWWYQVGNLLSSNGTVLYEGNHNEDLNDTSCLLSMHVSRWSNGWLTPSSDIMAKLQETLSLSDTFEGIAASLTQLGRDSRPSEVTGQVGLPVIYVHLRWEWLILPAVLEVAGIALLLSIMVMAKRAKTPLWKG